MGALPRPTLPPGAQRELNDALHDLHQRAGWPSLRTLDAQAGCSHTTVSPRPHLGTLELLVEAMDGDTTRFHPLGLAASAPEAWTGEGFALAPPTPPACPCLRLRGGARGAGQPRSDRALGEGRLGVGRARPPARHGVLPVARWPGRRAGSPGDGG